MPLVKVLVLVLCWLSFWASPALAAEKILTYSYPVNVGPVNPHLYLLNVAFAKPCFMTA